MMNDNNLDLPWMRIPEELWPIIFEYCLHPYDHCPSGDPIHIGENRDPRLMPMKLSWVCRKWRQIACRTSSLWKTCWVSYRHPELNEIWLGRAGTHLLHIYGATFNSQRSNWEPILRSLLPFQKRWKSFQLPAIGFGEMIPSPKFDCPALERIIFHRKCEPPLWANELLLNSPQLRELEIYSLSSRMLSSVAKNYVPNVAILTVGWTTPRGFLQLLSVLPQLEHLNVHIGIEPPFSDLPDIQATIHTNLISLQLDDAVAVLDQLTLPSLRTLHLVHDFDSSELLAFVRRSGCHISELRFGDCDIASAELAIVLQDSSVHPWIERLQLPTSDVYHMSCPIDAGLLGILRYDRDHTQYMPHLTYLSISINNYTELPDGAIADTIISRCSPRTCSCADCRLLGLKTKEVQLKHVVIDHLERAIHPLDIACLVPLPGDSVTDKRDAGLILDLVPVEWDDDHISFEEHPVQYSLPKRTLVH